MFSRLALTATERPLKPETLRALRTKLQEILKPGYFPAVPLKEILQVVHSLSLELLDDDGFALVGVLALGAQGKASYQLGYKQDGEYVPTSTWLHTQWYRMPSGKFEINAYVS